MTNRNNPINKPFFILTVLKMRGATWCHLILLCNFNKKGDKKRMSLREARTKKNLSQMQLAEMVDKAQCDISAFELRRRSIDQARPVTICKLAYVLGCKVWEIMDDKELSELLEKVSKYEKQGTNEVWSMRKRRNLHQYDLAAAVGVHKSTISEWEVLGMRNSRIKYIALLCDVMKCHPTDIIEDPELRQLMSEVF